MSTRPGRAGPPERRDCGPVQLAEYLYQVCGQGFGSVDNARYFGLLPEPDRCGGRRWSAALVAGIRERWPEISAAARCVGAYGLKECGWTESMIRDLLGKPDRYVDNPHYKSAGQMRLWRLQRVEAAETAPGFAQRKRRADRQCAGARKAAGTREIWKALGGGR